MLQIISACRDCDQPAEWVIGATATAPATAVYDHVMEMMATTNSDVNAGDIVIRHTDCSLTNTDPHKQDKLAKLRMIDMALDDYFNNNGDLAVQQALHDLWEILIPNHTNESEG